MCRYGFHVYKLHFACFRCRKTFKREDDAAPAPCPDCGTPMRDMGFDFASPPRRDVERWAVVATLFARGFAYHSCGCGGPGYRPSRRRDVPAFLAANEPRPEGLVLADRFARRRR